MIIAEHTYMSPHWRCMWVHACTPFPTHTHTHTHAHSQTNKHTNKQLIWLSETKLSVIFCWLSVWHLIIWVGTNQYSYSSAGICVCVCVCVCVFILFVLKFYLLHVIYNLFIYSFKNVCLFVCFFIFALYHWQEIMFHHQFI